MSSADRDVATDSPVPPAAASLLSSPVCSEDDDAMAARSGASGEPDGLEGLELLGRRDLEEEP